MILLAGGVRSPVVVVPGLDDYQFLVGEAALLAGDPLVDVDEAAPLRPDSGAAYCAVKAISEKTVLDANAPGFATVSVRPRFVWGADNFLIDGLVAAARAGQFACGPSRWMRTAPAG